MMNLLKGVIALISIFLMTCWINLYSQSINLSGKWSIATDMTEKGVEHDWHEPFNPNTQGLAQGWDAVEVPHCFTLDSRYNITGKVWYRKSFNLPENTNEKVCRIRFASVFYKTRVWVNGMYIGTHEGGYTPFVYDLTKYVKPGNNFISVEVDNRWDAFTIPAARTEPYNKGQVYPWIEYGGITGDVKIMLTDKVFIINQKIEPDIDLKKNTAVIKLKTWVNLYDTLSQAITIEGYIAFSEKPDVLVARIPSNVVNVIPYSDNLILQKVSLKPEQVKLWDFDHPDLYTITTIVKHGSMTDTFRVRTGLRVIEAREGKLLLNGQPVRMGGANRHRDYPGYGSLDPLHVVKTDMEIMKTGNMLLTRLHHYPANETLLDWADENGMLIIEEIPVWQMTDPQLIDPILQAKAAIQAREMVERDWNRPSVIGWSGGNEYNTWTPEGDLYSKFITDFFRSLDPTRLATIVSWVHATSPENISAAHNSFRHCDIICINYYIESDLDLHLERLHRKFPEKPVMIAEFGKLSLQTNEEARIKNLMYYVNTVRKYPFVAGISWWTINDYHSRYPGTHPDGYRSFGLVNEAREKLDTYFVAQKEFSPLKVEQAGTVFKLTSRDDFPSFIVKDYKIRVLNGDKVIREVPVPQLNPGMSFSADIPETSQEGILIRIISAGGFVVNEIK